MTRLPAEVDVAVIGAGAAGIAATRRLAEPGGGISVLPTEAREPGGRWNALFDAVSTWANAVELEALSVKDSDRYEDSGVNWRLYKGYGRLFEALAAGLPTALATAATRIDRRGRTLLIETSRGA